MGKLNSSRCICSVTGNERAAYSVKASCLLSLIHILQLPNQYALSKLNFKAAIEDLNKAKEDIAINVTSSYLQVLFNMELNKVAASQVELSKEQCKRITRLADVGKASAAEVAEAKARVAQDEMSLVQAENNYQLALLNLSQLLELSTPKGFSLAQPDTLVDLSLRHI